MFIVKWILTFILLSIITLFMLGIRTDLARLGPYPYILPVTCQYYSLSIHISSLLHWMDRISGLTKDQGRFINDNVNRQIM